MDYAATILSKLPGALKRDHGMRHLVDTLQGYLPQDQIDTIVRAYEFGAAAHEGQTRKTGEPYISHPVAVAQSLAEGLIAIALAQYINPGCPCVIGTFTSRS